MNMTRLLTTAAIVAGTAQFAAAQEKVTWWYEQATPDQQKLITETTGPDRAAWFGALWDEGEAHGRDYMEKAGDTIVTLTKEQVSGLHEAFKGITDDAVAKAGGNAADFVKAYTE